jgi:dihydropteroate synthase
MGILNITPDSFSDGGKFFDLEKAVLRGKEMEKEGADIIDIGGESTRPGSDPISLEEELKRVIPVIESLSKEVSIPISIDTYKSEVAFEALRAGAEMVNDISALRFDPKMKEVVAKFDVPIVLMHIKGTPKNMQQKPIYADLFGEIISYLDESIKMAVQSGVSEDKIIIDPGIGFGKKLEHNLKILKELDKFKVLEKPILVGVSRKSFIGQLTNAEVNDRLEGSLSALTVAILEGANIVRVHDVIESVRAAKVVDAILRG